MSGAFALEPAGDGVVTLRFDLPGRRANIFTREALAELERLVRELAERRDVRMLVLASGKPDVFIAGADVDEIAGVVEPAVAEAGARYGQRLFSAWAALPFPTLAAIRGTCLGGGTELALASTWIVVSDRPDLRIGLPEVQLGIVPGWGGSTRLPRRVGLVAALGMILPGKAVAGRRALAIGLADALLPDAGFAEHALEFARAKAGAPPPQRGPRGARAALLERNPVGRSLVLARARRGILARTRGHYPAPLRALEVVRRGLTRGEGDGFDAEARAIGELATTPVTKNLIHVFRLIEQSKKAGRDSGPPPREIRRAAVVGAGLMGGGIAALVAGRAGVPVRLRDVRPEPLAAALAHADEQLERALRERRSTAAEKRRRLALIQPSLEEAGLESCDLVVEAIVEDLAAKQRLFADLGRRAPGAILATNTSSLSIDAIGQLVADRERVVGMHFFNPVDRMPLVEVVAGPRTGEAAVRAVTAFARRLGKTPVRVREGPGFLVNRLLAFCSAAALRLLDEGHRVETIDGAMLDWGMPMGPLRLADEVGLDVSARVAHQLQAAFPDRLRFPSWLERLPSSGRTGVKGGLGVYRYAGRRERGVDPAIYALVGRRPARGRTDRAALADRMILPMVDEAARCLEEGIVEGPGPLDLAMIFGTGFPPFRGGLCRWADSIGLATVILRLEAAAGGGTPPPSDALRRLAAAGGFYASRS